jgi:hypothetical protein
MPGITAPYFSYEDPRRKADAFLTEYHPDRTIPVPIEEIVESRLRLDIVPIPGLHRLLDIDGFLLGNLREIWVDDGLYQNYPGRYRFTLAHEVGHLVLHREVYIAHPFGSIDGWKRFHNSIPDREHGWSEYHGYAFAGLVLVPGDVLRTEARKCLSRVKREGIPLKENWDFAWNRIAAFLAKQL